MNFPIQACAACGEQTENLYCPNCRRKLTRDEIKVFWNPQSWAQYRATVLDFQSFSSSLPYLETRVLDSPPGDAPPARKMGLLVALVAAALVGLGLLALWFTRVHTPAGPTSDVVEGPKVDKNGRPVPKIGVVRTLTPRPSPGARTPRPRGTAVPGAPPIDPQVEDVCGVGSSNPAAAPPDALDEELCGVGPAPPAAPPGPEDVCGSTAEPPNPSDQQEAEEISQNAQKGNSSPN
jgi:hypothetical protein